MSNSVTSDRQSLVFNSLVGEWKLNRIISDTAMIKGVARFIPKKHGQLHYIERCQVSLNTGQNFNASQEYLYCVQDNAIAVFAITNHSQTLMHQLVFTSDGAFLKATSRYICNDDFYDAIFLFQHDRMHLTYRVKGPSKNFFIHSHLERSNCHPEPRPSPG